MDCSDPGWARELAARLNWRESREPLSGQLIRRRRIGNQPDIVPQRGLSPGEAQDMAQQTAHGRAETMNDTHALAEPPNR